MVQSVLRGKEMQVETGHSKLTYDDLAALPDDNFRHEIIDGEHYVTPSPVTKHQRISRELLYLLVQFLKAQPVGEVFSAPFDVVLSRYDVVEPDLVYLSNERASLLTEKSLQGAPDLVVEILSPGTSLRDVGIKRDLYERFGVREYWVIDPDLEAVTVHRRHGDQLKAVGIVAREGDGVVTSPLLPGFEAPLSALFPTGRPT
jgi:Uma2 family endonuclease